MGRHSRNQPIKRLRVWRVHTFTITVRPKLTAQTNKAIFTLCVWGRKNRESDKQNPFPHVYPVISDPEFIQDWNKSLQVCAVCDVQRIIKERSLFVRKSWMKIFDCNLNNYSRSMLLKWSLQRSPENMGPSQLKCQAGLIYVRCHGMASSEIQVLSVSDCDLSSGYFKVILHLYLCHKIQCIAKQFKH